MTITEQLHFSVLTAPVAALDRRALSQAWYSALYGDGRAAHSGAKTRSISAQTLLKSNTQSAAVQRPGEPAQRPVSRAGSAAARLREDGEPFDRRAPRSALARKIERAFLRPHNAARKTSFTLDGEHGRVHIVLQTNGSRLQLVAICAPNSRRSVAQALAQARYALALRGIDLETVTREAPQC